MSIQVFTNVPVTAEQYGQLQVAWFLCSYPGTRRLSGERCSEWHESVQHILGYVPEGAWSPVISVQREGGEK